jgi:hypothetical protein
VLVQAQSDTGLARPDPYFGTDRAGRGTGLWIHGIRSVTGYHGNELGRYQQLVATGVGANGATPAIMTPMFWRHENTRYFYTNAPVADAQLTLLTGPVKNSAGSTVYLYRLPGDNPYAWVAPAITKAPDEEVKAAVLDPRFDPLRIAVFDTASKLSASPPATLPEPLALRASTTDLRPGHASISFSAPAPAGSALVVSENYYPGWSATIDGRPAPVYRANFNLIGIPLPAGAQRVELSFQDAAVATGKIVTIASVLLALAVLAGGVVVDRRVRLG